MNLRIDDEQQFVRHCRVPSAQNFAAQMAGGFDEKAGGAQMGVMQGPMVSQSRLRPLLLLPYVSNIDPFLT